MGTYRHVGVTVPNSLHLRVRQYALLHNLTIATIVRSLLAQLLEDDQAPPEECPPQVERGN
jgi:hypothetical protein